MKKDPVYDWEATKEQAKINIEFALDIIDDYYGNNQQAREDGCSKERLIAFQEVLRVIMPTALVKSKPTIGEKGHV